MGGRRGELASDGATQTSRRLVYAETSYTTGGASGGERPILLHGVLSPRGVAYVFTLTPGKRGGRKRIVTLDGSEWATRPQVYTAMVKALARAFRWKRMLESGEFATIAELAER